MKNFKLKLVTLLKEQLQAREKDLRHELAQLKESLYSETKSTAGDKHETGRAMTHLEQEKLGTRLQQLIQQQNILKQIDFTASYPTARMGSLIETNQAFYLIAIAFGTLSVGDISCFILSPASPMGKLLMGTKAAEKIPFRGTEIEISGIH